MSKPARIAFTVVATTSLALGIGTVAESAHLAIDFSFAANHARLKTLAQNRLTEEKNYANAGYVTLNEEGIKDLILDPKSFNPDNGKDFSAGVKMAFYPDPRLSNGAPPTVYVEDCQPHAALCKTIRAIAI